MKRLPNGNLAFYHEGGILSLIMGILFALVIIATYFEKGLSWTAAPFVVVCIMLFKNFFKPTAQLIISPEGVEFFRYQKIFNRKVKLFWTQIAKVFYDRRMQTTDNISYTVEILLFKTFKNNKDITYKFEISDISMDDRKQLYSILEEHNFIIMELLHKPPTR